MQDLCHWSRSTKHGPENNVEEEPRGVANTVQALVWTFRHGITHVNVEFQARMLGPHETLGCQ